MNRLSFLFSVSFFIIFTYICNAQNPAAKCAAALAHPISLPYYSPNDFTCGLGNDFLDTNTVACGNTAYLGGEDHLYVFTADSSGNIQVRINSATTFIGIFVYIGCPTNGICVGTQGAQTGSDQFTFYAIAGVTYYIVIDNWPLPDCIPSYSIFIGKPLPPSIQDCAGAIPITTCFYTQNDTFNGMGNVLNEVNPTTSCLAFGEENSCWYTFTITHSGNLDFMLTPFNLGENFDWGLYLLTNDHPCDSIYSIPSMEISCNESGNVFFGDSTGANGGSNFTSQPGPGTPFNALVPVTTGQTYALLVNWHYKPDVVNCGYTLDFCRSTAKLFDSIPPKFSALAAGNTCNSDSLKINFTKNVLCSSVIPSDFAITGPGGPYSITAIHSTACDTGGYGDSSFVLTVSPPLTIAGNYHLIIDGTITDLSNINFVIPYSKPFTISTMSATEAITATPCNSANGSVSITVNGGSAPYSFNWNPAAANTANLGNLASGTWYLTITDANGCVLDTSIVIGNGSSLVATIVIDSAIICNGGSNSQAHVNATGGATPYTYLWSTSATTDTVSNLTAGFYLCIVTDAVNCTFIAQINITQPPSFSANAGNNQSICYGKNVLLGAINPALGGTPPYTYSWSPTSTLNDSTIANPLATPTVATYYTLTVTDSKGCTTVSNTDTISIYPVPATPVVTVNGTLLTSTSAVSYQWCFNGVPDSGATNQTFTINNFGAYTVITTDANGCSATSLPYGYVGIPSIQNEPPKFSLFPNPNHGTFEITFNNSKPQHFTFTVYDITGQIIYANKKTIDAGKYNQSFDFSHLAKGIYTFNLVSEQYNSNRKLIIE